MERKKRTKKAKALQERKAFADAAEAADVHGSDSLRGGCRSFSFVLRGEVPD